MKKSPDKINLTRLIVTVPSLISILIIIVMGFFLEGREYNEFKDESSRARNEFMMMQKDQLKNQVNQTIEFIDYNRSTTEKRLKEDIQGRVEEAHAIATSIYREHIGNKSKADVIKLILDALRPIRFNHGRGYYFATGLDGVEILFADHPELEGKDLLDMRDTKGAYVIRDMIEIVRRDGQGFYQYTWTKPNVKGRQFPKIAYLKYFEPFNGFIGTGEYLDDVEHDIQKEVLERIGKIRFGKDGYIFVVSYDGVTLMNGIQQEMIGQNHWDLTDANGVKIIQEERKAADNPKGDFIHYLWQKPSSNVVAPKMSYVKGVPDWRWMVGSGLYMDEIETVIAQKEYAVWEDIKKDLLITGGITCIFFLFILMGTSFTARHLQKGFDAFFSFFKEMEHGGAPIDVAKLRYNEFAVLADSANSMLAIKNQMEGHFKESEARYRALFDRSLDCVYLHDFEGNFIDANDAALKILGYSRNEICSVNFATIVSDDHLHRVIEETKRFIELGYQKKPVELKLKHKNGQTVHVEITASIIYKSGKPYAVQGIARDLTERKRVEQAVLEERERLEAILFAQNTGLSVINPDMTIQWVSRKIREMFPNSEPKGQKCYQFYESRESICDHCGTALAFKEGRITETERLNPLNNRWYHILSLPIKNDQGIVINVIEGITDITQRKLAESERAELEEQLFQAQRLESVGRLAGGVAHDFNNMLSVIIGYSEMALDQIQPDDPLHMDIQEILASAKRSADLTRQLLAFARRQPLEMRALDMNQTIQGLMKLIRRTLRENIAIKTHLAPEIEMINADIGQIEQVIMKLAVNAQDAMPNGGKLTIETSEIVLDQVSMEVKQDILPGRYICIKISDTGIGMSKEIREHIFEPFFTTKGLGKGSGLGLAVIYGIVKQHQGHILVESEPGNGTMFSLYFPVRKEAETQEKVEIEMSERIEGTETILLVEDETQVREMACRILKRYGYTMLEAFDGKNAIDIASSFPNTIDLLITDVIMPDMNGKDVFTKLADMRPGIKAVFISGYTEHIIGQDGLLEDGIAFVQKPFAVMDFLKKVRHVLDSGK